MLRTLFHLIGAHYASGNYGAVESTLRSVLATVPNDPASLQLLGLVYYRTGRKAEAMDILQSMPPLAFAQTQFERSSGGNFLGRNAYSAAAACQLEATQRNPDLALAWLDLGLTFAEMGQPDRAILAFRSALLSRPGFPAAVGAMNSLAQRAGMTLHAAGVEPPSEMIDEDDCDPGRVPDQAAGAINWNRTALDDDA